MQEICPRVNCEYNSYCYCMCCDDIHNPDLECMSFIDKNEGEENMKKTGIVRRIDDLGRVVIPKEVRSIYAIDYGDPLEIIVEEDGIKLKRYLPNYDFLDMMNDLEKRFNMSLEYVGHPNNVEVKQKFKELKEAYMNTEIAI